MSNEILYFGSNSSDTEFLSELCKSTQTTLKSLNSAATLADEINRIPQPTVFLDVQNEAQFKSIESTLIERLGMLSDKLNSNYFHLLSSHDLGEASYLIDSPLFGGFLVRSYKDSQGAKDAGLHYANIVRANRSGRAFELKNQLSSAAKIQTIPITHSSQKQKVAEGIRNHLATIGFQNRMATIVANAVDEIIMNAIFDAPVDELGKPIYMSASRATALNLTDKQSIEVNYGIDGEYIAVSVSDQFGSLDRAKLLKHVSKVYTDEEYRVKTNVAGAGIGLATVFRLGGSLFFVSEAQSRTEVTVSFRKTSNFKEFRDQFRFIATQFYF